jgi:FAD dependent oxidoreductase central domain
MVHPPVILKASWSRRSWIASCHIWNARPSASRCSRSRASSVLSRAQFRTLRTVHHSPGPRPEPATTGCIAEPRWVICQGAGISRFLAQWIVHGQPEISAREYDPRRFGDWVTPEFTRAVGIADYQHMYYCYKPAEQHKVGRDLRRSSLHDTLKARDRAIAAGARIETEALVWGGFAADEIAALVGATAGVLA